MDYVVACARVFAKVMDLGMAIVTWGDAILSLCCQNLIELYLAILPPCFSVAGLQEATTAAAAEIVRPVGLHFDKVFFPHHGFDHKAKIFGHRIAQGLSDQLTGILNRELDL